MRTFLLTLAVAGAISLGGCATRERDAAAVNQNLSGRNLASADWTRADTSNEAPLAAGQVLSLQQSLELAFSRSPVIREQYAELGLGVADVLDAAQLPDLGLEYSRLSFGDGHAQVTRGVSVALADLLLMRSRLRIAHAGQAATRDRVAATLGDLEAQVQAAWYEYTAALHSAEVQARAAKAARASAEYARRLHAAGNLPPRALAQEIAAASAAEIESARAAAHSLEARSAFATLVGLSVRDDWRLAPILPVPANEDLPPDLARRSLDARLELAAARREAALFEQAWRVTRFWRWLGDFEVGYEREREHGSVSRGPTFRLGLPLLHWNRAGVLRARASMESAQARVAALELATSNDVSLALDRVDTARRIAEIYRDTLVPQREAVSARTIEEVNFMLAGAFEALAARGEQFAAYQEYIEAVRDYWLARVELRRITGGLLAAAAPAGTLEIEAPAPTPAHSHGDHK